MHKKIKIFDSFYQLPMEEYDLFGYPNFEQAKKLVQNLKHNHTNYEEIIRNLEPHEDNTDFRVELKIVIFNLIKNKYPFLRSAVSFLIKREKTRLNRHFDLCF